MNDESIKNGGILKGKMGLGGGGHSKLGLAKGLPEAHSIQLVRSAFDHGIRTFDTAESYGTEEIIGKAIKPFRNEITLCSKASSYDWSERRMRTAAEYQETLDNSLKKLHTDRIDLYQVHGLEKKYYDQTIETILPVLLKAKQEGKIRAIGLTEPFGIDPTHEMLRVAVENPIWDSFMVGFNLANQTARELVFQHTIRSKIEILGMFAVRQAWHSVENATKVLAEHPSGSQNIPEGKSIKTYLEDLVDRSGSKDLAELGYRFSLIEAGMTCVLFGTSSIDHLKANIAALKLPQLDPLIYKEINHAFGHLTDLTGNEGEV